MKKYCLALSKIKRVSQKKGLHYSYYSKPKLHHSFLKVGNISQDGTC